MPQKSTPAPHSRQSDPFLNPANHLAPGETWIVDGLDWSWAFVVFAEIDGFPGYAIGSNGSFWSRRIGGYRGKRGMRSHWKRFMGSPMKTGHLRISLHNGSTRRRTFIHELVLEAFIGPRPDGMFVRHFPDRTPSNNNLWNLHWGTPQENCDDRTIHGTQLQGTRSPNAKLTEAKVEEILRTITPDMELKEIAARFGVNGSRLSHIFAGRAWNHVKGERPIHDFRQKKLRDDDISHMFRLYEQGWRKTDIARRFGVAFSTVSRTLSGELHVKRKTSGST